MPATTAAEVAGLAWDWTTALFAAVCTLPAAVIALDDPTQGIALALGVLPAALVGVLPRRRARVVVVLFGLLIGVPIFVGGALAGVPVLAVAAIAALGVGSVALARRSRVGTVVMNVSLPMVGVGLSYADVGKVAEIGGLMIAGSAFACAVSMLWPERPPAPPREQPPKPTVEYGVRLGLAGATAAAIGFLFDLEHVGWACAAALLVMRPAPEMQRLRSAGRIVAVALGALLAVALIRSEPAAGVLALAVLAAVVGAGGTHHSRWYVTAGFTTFLVFLLLLYSSPEDAGSRFGERVGETVLGVGLAYLVGLMIPQCLRLTGAPARND